MKKLEPEPAVEMHPVDAQQRNILDHQFVRVWNDRGRVVLRCRLSANLRQGVVVIPEGSWVKDFAAGDPYSLTHEQVSPTSNNYAFFDTLVEIEPVFEASDARTGSTVANQPLSPPRVNSPFTVT
jgi:molybdopterin-containing oxidoreductase family molybdopterin binding subunit